jgi:hypothetical protein
MSQKGRRGEGIEKVGKGYQVIEQRVRKKAGRGKINGGKQC